MCQFFSWHLFASMAGLSVGGPSELRVVRNERQCAKDISTNRKGTHEARTSSPPTLPVSDPLPWNGRRDPVGVRDFLNLIAPNGLASTRRRQRF